MSRMTNVDVPIDVNNGITVHWVSGCLLENDSRTEKGVPHGMGGYLDRGTWKLEHVLGLEILFIFVH